jgi:hypothetical protein
MSMLTLGQASKLVGKSKPTISKAVKDGKLTGQKVDGVFQIEKSELIRVYGEQPKQSGKTTTASKPTGGSAVAELEKKHLEEKVADLEARLAKAEDKAETAETRERKSLMQRLLGK